MPVGVPMKIVLKPCVRHSDPREIESVNVNANKRRKMPPMHHRHPQHNPQHRLRDPLAIAVHHQHHHRPAWATHHQLPQCQVVRRRHNINKSIRQAIPLWDFHPHHTTPCQTVRHQHPPVWPRHQVPPPQVAYHRLAVVMAVVLACRPPTYHRIHHPLIIMPPHRRP